MFVAWPLLLSQVLFLLLVLLVELEPEPTVLQAVLATIELKTCN